MNKPIFAAAVGSLLSGCSLLELDDELRGEAVAPDGRLVARAWCLDGCDVTTGRTITIAEAGRRPGRRAPARDIVQRVYIAENDSAEVTLRWIGDWKLQVAGPCLAGADLRPLAEQRVREVSIEFVRIPATQSCWDHLVARPSWQMEPISRERRQAKRQQKSSEASV